MTHATLRKRLESEQAEVDRMRLEGGTVATAERLNELVEEYDRSKDKAERKLEEYKRILAESRRRSQEARKVLRRAHYRR